METRALQELVKKIFSDEKTMVEFKNDPEKVITRFRLTEPERKAVLVTETKLGLATAGGPILDEAVDPTILWNSPIP